MGEGATLRWRALSAPLYGCDEMLAQKSIPVVPMTGARTSLSVRSVASLWGPSSGGRAMGGTMPTAGWLEPSRRRVRVLESSIPATTAIPSLKAGFSLSTSLV